MLEYPKVPTKFKQLGGTHPFGCKGVPKKSMKSFGEIGQAHPHKVVWAATHAPIDEREIFVLVRDDLYRSVKINPNFNGMFMGPNYNIVCMYAIFWANLSIIVIFYYLHKDKC
jgi:hypothetical protein